MIRVEAALVATFGATLGVSLGLLFGFGVVMALPASVASNVSIPVLQIAVLMLVAAIAGVAAAWLPPDEPAVLWVYVDEELAQEVGRDHERRAGKKRRWERLHGVTFGDETP